MERKLTYSFPLSSRSPLSLTKTASSSSSRTRSSGSETCVDSSPASAIVETVGSMNGAGGRWCDILPGAVGEEPLFLRIQFRFANEDRSTGADGVTLYICTRRVYSQARAYHVNRVGLPSGMCAESSARPSPLSDPGPGSFQRHVTGARTTPPQSGESLGAGTLGPQCLLWARIIDSDLPSQNGCLTQPRRQLHAVRGCLSSDNARICSCLPGPWRRVPPPHGAARRDAAGSQRPLPARAAPLPSTEAARGAGLRDNPRLGR